MSIYLSEMSISSVSEMSIYVSEMSISVRDVAI